MYYSPKCAGYYIYYSPKCAGYYMFFSLNVLVTICFFSLNVLVNICFTRLFVLVTIWFTPLNVLVTICFTHLIRHLIRRVLDVQSHWLYLTLCENRETNGYQGMTFQFVWRVWTFVYTHKESMYTLYKSTKT